MCRDWWSLSFCMNLPCNWSMLNVSVNEMCSQSLLWRSTASKWREKQGFFFFNKSMWWALCWLNAVLNLLGVYLCVCVDAWGHGRGVCVCVFCWKWKKGGRIDGHLGGRLSNSDGLMSVFLCLVASFNQEWHIIFPVFSGLIYQFSSSFSSALSFWLRWRTQFHPLFHLNGSKSAGQLTHLCITNNTYMYYFFFLALILIFIVWCQKSHLTYLTWIAQ